MVCDDEDPSAKKEMVQVKVEELLESCKYIASSWWF
nr:hypothetical protein [Tanacetum cinerariifolium]